MKIGMRKRVRINKENYSESSKRSVGHEFLGDYYEDIEYKCLKCHKNAVFLAQDQKEAFEVRKVYMWKNRNLCGLCWKEYNQIKNRLLELETEHGSVKKNIVRESDVLNEWLGLLKEYPKFGKKADIGKIHAITQALQDT